MSFINKSGMFSLGINRKKFFDYKKTRSSALFCLPAPCIS